MLNYLKKSLVLSTFVKKRISTDDLQHLELLKNGLRSRFGMPVGIHMTGIPVGISTVLTLFCYAMPQVSLSMLIFHRLGLPEYKVMAGVFFAAIAYSAVVITTMMLTARGSLIGFKCHLAVTGLTGAIASIYFVTSWLSLLSGAVDNYTPQITSVLGILFFTMNVKIINSSMFYRSIALTLHNRVWRKQLKIQKRLVDWFRR